MPETTVASADSRRQVHTEVRLPPEAVMTRVVWFVFAVIEVLIALRFALKLFGANVEAGFVQMVYGVSGIFMAPFEAIFSTQRVAATTFEWSALAAIAVYALVAWGTVALIRAVNPRQHAETVERVVKDDGSMASR